MTPRAFEECEPENLKAPSVAPLALAVTVAAMAVAALLVVSSQDGLAFFGLPRGWGLIKLAIIVWVAASGILSARLLLWVDGRLRAYNLVWALTTVTVVIVCFLYGHQEWLPPGLLLFGALVSACTAWLDARLAASDDAA